MTSSICCTRDANISVSSAMGARPEVRVSNNNCLIFSPVAVPPGSRVTTTGKPLARKAAANFSVCVLLPQPSRPSKVMNLPRRELTQEIIQERLLGDAVAFDCYIQTFVHGGFMEMS